jgi:rhodanese-related sulfurtransferase
MEDPEWRINTRFSQAVFALLVDTHYPLDAEIILIGRAGRLSMEAGELLIKKGFKNVAHPMAGHHNTSHPNYRVALERLDALQSP